MNSKKGKTTGSTKSKTIEHKSAGHKIIEHKGTGHKSAEHKRTGHKSVEQKSAEHKRSIWKPGNMLYPLPAVLVSCSMNGKNNVLTAAWAGTICSDPVMVSVSIRKSRYSHEIISSTKEFVINLTTCNMVKAVDYCGVVSGRDKDKFKESGLTAIKSRKVDAVSIAQSPVCLECKVEKVIELGSHDMFMARVLAVTVDEKYMDENGRFDLKKANLMAYSHGEYFGLTKDPTGSFGFSVRKKQ